MRSVAIKIQTNATKKVMLIENSRDERYRGGVVCHIWIDNHGGPAEAGEFYNGFTINEVMQELEELYGIRRSDWSTLPDE
jgi:hypothetical protein